MKKPSHNPLSHYGKTTWQKPKKPVKAPDPAKPQPDGDPKIASGLWDDYLKNNSLDDLAKDAMWQMWQTDIVAQQSSTFDWAEVSKQAKFGLLYGAGPSQLAKWFELTIEDRAQRMRSDMGKRPRVELMVAFANLEVNRERNKWDSDYDLIKTKLSTLHHYNLAQHRTIIDQQRQIETLQEELRLSRAEVSYRQRLAATLPAEGRLFREAV